MSSWYTMLDENKDYIDDMSVEVEESNVEMEIEITTDRSSRKRQLRNVSGAKDPGRDVKKCPNSSPMKSPIESSSKIMEPNLFISTEPPTKNKKHPVEAKSDNASTAFKLKYIKLDMGPFKVNLTYNKPNEERQNDPLPPKDIEVAKMLVKNGIKFKEIVRCSRFKWMIIFISKSDVNNTLNNVFIRKCNFIISIP